MARILQEDNDKVYRVRKATTYTSDHPYTPGETTVRYYGPYATKAAAKTRLKRATPDVENSTFIESVSSKIQVSDLKWEDI